MKRKITPHQRKIEFYTNTVPAWRKIVISLLSMVTCALFPFAPLFAAQENPSLNLPQVTIAYEKVSKLEEVVHPPAPSLTSPGLLDDAALALKAPKVPAFEVPTKLWPKIQSPDSSLVGSSMTAWIYRLSHGGKRAYFDEGAFWLKKGNYQRAIRKFKKFRSAFPVGPDARKALFFSAEARYLQGQIEQSVNIHFQLLKEYPQDPMAPYSHFRLLWYYYQKQEWLLAQNHAQSIIDHFDNRPPCEPALILSAIIAARSAAYDRCAETAEKIVQQYPLSNWMEQAHFLLAEATFYQKKWQDAVLRYGNFLANFTSSQLRGDARLGKAWALMKAGQGEKALQEFSKLAQSDETLSTQANYGRALQLIRLERYKEAVKALESVIENAAAGQELIGRAHYVIGRLFFDMEKYEAAERAFSTVMASFSETKSAPAARFMLGELSFKRQQYPKALEYYHSLSEGGTTAESLVVLSRFRIGWTLFAAGEYQKAAAHFGKLVTQFSDNQAQLVESATFWHGQSLARSGDLEAALSRFSEFLLRFPRSSLTPYVYFSRAYCFVRQKRWTDALASLHKILDAGMMTRVLQPLAVYQTAICYFNEGDLETAFRWFSEFKSKYAAHPLLPYTLSHLGDMSFRRERFNEAMKYYTQCLNSNPPQELRIHAKAQVAWTHFRLNKYQDAARAFLEFVVSFPEDSRAPECLLARGDCYYNMNRFHQAIDVYRQVVKQYPQTESAVAAQYDVGLCYYRLKKFDAFVRESKQMLEKNPDNPLGHVIQFLTAEQFADSHKYRKAIEIYSEIIKKYKGQPLTGHALFRRADLWEKQGKDEAAIADYQRLVNDFPISKLVPDSLFFMAKLLFKQNRLGKVKELLLRLSEEFPDHERRPEAQFLLGKVAERQGEAEKALDIFNRTAASYPNSPVAMEATLNAGELHLEKGEAAKSLPYFDEVIASKRKSLKVQAQFNKARALEKLGKKQKALMAYLRVVYLYPGFKGWQIKARYQAAELSLEMGKKKDAVMLFKKVAGSNVDAQLSATAKARLATITNLN